MDASTSNQLRTLGEKYKNQEYYERMGKFATHKRKYPILKTLQYGISHYTMTVHDPTNENLKINTVSYYMEPREIETKRFFNLASEEGKSLGNTEPITGNREKNPTKISFGAELELGVESCIWVIDTHLAHLRKVGLPPVIQRIHISSKYKEEGRLSRPYNLYSVNS